MAKKTFNDSFKEGMGGEMGKRTGTVVFGIIALAIATLLGIRGCDPSTPSSSQPSAVDKSYGNSGNTQ